MAGPGKMQHHAQAGGVVFPGVKALYATLDALPYSVMLVDSRHRILFANRVAGRELEAPPESLLGQYCARAVHGCKGPVLGCPLEEAVQEGKPVVREVFDPARQRWGRVGVYPTGFQTTEGVPVFLHTARDATVEVETQQRLAHRYEVERVLRRILAVSALPVPLADQLGLALEAILSLPGIRVEHKGAIFVSEGGRLFMAAQRGLPEGARVTCREAPHGQCLCGRAAATGAIQTSIGLHDGHEVLYPGIEPHGHCCIPVKDGGNVLGVVNLYLPPGLVLSDDEVQLLETLTAVVGKVIAHGRSEEEAVQGRCGTEASLAPSHVYRHI